jgi:hypothetical protein
MKQPPDFALSRIIVSACIGFWHPQTHFSEVNPVRQPKQDNPVKFSTSVLSMNIVPPQFGHGDSGIT